MGLDFGAHTCGVSVSDALMITAQGVETIRREKPTKYRTTLARIGELVEKYSVTRFVLGLPLGLDGIEGERCEKTRDFAMHLSKRFPDIPIDFQDERFTTVESYESMAITHVKNKDKKKYVDELAAVIILERYMEEHREKQA